MQYNTARAPVPAMNLVLKITNTKQRTQAAAKGARALYCEHNTP
jgi:hypothetical protein